MKNVTTYSVLDVIAISVATIEIHGFVSKANGSAQTPSTASRVQEYLLSHEPQVISEITEANADWTNQALELIEWAKENLKGDFGYNVKQMLAKGSITINQVPFLVTLPNQFALAQSREAVKEELAKTTAKSEWFGTITKRAEFFVKLTGKKFVESYGSYIYNIVTREGNIGSFFSQNNFELIEGDCFIMKATPKRHIVSQWHGGKETQFNRVVIKEVIGKKEA